MSRFCTSIHARSRIDVRPLLRNALSIFAKRNPVVSVVAFTHAMSVNSPVTSTAEPLSCEENRQSLQDAIYDSCWLVIMGFIHVASSVRCTRSVRDEDSNGDEPKFRLRTVFVPLTH